MRMHGAGAEAGKTSTKVKMELSGVRVRGHDTGVQAGEARWSRHARRAVRIRGGRSERARHAHPQHLCGHGSPRCHGERRSAGETAKGSSESGKQMNGQHEHADREVRGPMVRASGAWAGRVRGSKGAAVLQVYGLNADGRREGGKRGRGARGQREGYGCTVWTSASASPVGRAEQYACRLYTRCMQECRRDCRCIWVLVKRCTSYMTRNS
jgi:hypothetical protein